MKFILFALLIITFLAVGTSHAAPFGLVYDSTHTGWKFVSNGGSGGTTVCKAVGADGVDTNEGDFGVSGIIASKYGSNATWFTAEMTRLGSWGYNYAGSESDYASFNWTPTIGTNTGVYTFNNDQLGGWASRNEGAGHYFLAKSVYQLGDSANISSITASGTTITVNLSQAISLNQNQYVNIINASPSAYSGQWQVTTVISSTSFKFTGPSGYGSGSAAGWVTTSLPVCGQWFAGYQPDYIDNTIQTAYNTNLSFSAGFSITSSAFSTQIPSLLAWNPEEQDHFFGVDDPWGHADMAAVVAQQIPVFQNCQNEWCGTPGVPYGTTATTAATTHELYIKQFYRDVLATEYGCTSGSGFAISAISETGHLVTVTHASSFTPAAGTLIQISGTSPAGYEGAFAVLPGATSTQLQYVLTQQSGLSSGSSGTVTAGGSADPSASNYCGSTLALNSLVAKNTAWGETGSVTCSATQPNQICNSPDTTWNTSDANGLAGISSTAASSPYISYCVGTGFLDDCGRKILPLSTSCNLAENTDGGAGSAYQVNNWARTTTILNDLHAASDAFMVEYGVLLSNAEASAVTSGTTFPAVFPGIYGGNPRYYMDLAPFVNGFWVGDDLRSDLVTAEIAAIDSTTSDTNGAKVIVANFTIGNDQTLTDSEAQTFSNSCQPVSTNLANSNTPCYHNQGTRSTAEISYDETLLGMLNAKHNHAVIGLEHYALPDFSLRAPGVLGGQNADFGLVSGSQDNPYDGSSSTTIASAGSCATSHVYTAPAICLDANSNYEGFAGKNGAGATCTTGGSLPTWATANGGLTQSSTSGTDSGGGNCEWENSGSIRTAELNTYQLGATGSAGTYGTSTSGNYIIPMANFFTGKTTWIDSNGISRTGVCDPLASGPTPTPTPTPSSTPTNTPTPTGTPTPNPGGVGGAGW